MTSLTRGQRDQTKGRGPLADQQNPKQILVKNESTIKALFILYLLQLAAQVTCQCPEKTMTSFEKISGVTIKDAPLTILFSAPNFTSTTSAPGFSSSNQLNDLTRQLGSSLSSSATTAGVYPITAECNNRCRRNPKCRAFLVDYSRHTCWSVEQQQQGSSSSGGLIRAPTPIQLAQTNERTAYFEKVCLNLPAVDCERAWIFERAINYHLHGYDDKVIEDVPSRLRCQEHCLNEREFKCRSGEYDYLSMQCRLSASDRHLKPNLYRPTTSTMMISSTSTSANSLVDYFENQCVPMSSNQQCDSFDRFEDLDLGRPEIMRLFNTSDQCQQYCTQTIKAFICRSFTWSPLTGKCYLNSANSFMVGGIDKLIPAPGLIYYQRNDCIDLKLECDTSAMTLNLRTSEPFRGRMYVRDDPHTCGDTSLARGGGAGGGLINSLVIPFQSNGARCANRELPSRYSSIVVVQQHPLIQRKSDRYIKLVCDFQTANKTITSTYNVVANPWTSTALINATSFAPKIKLRITDKYGQDITGAKLGDELQLRIEAETESVYDMVARSVLAKSGQTDESIVLIDRDGCPADYRILPPLRKLNKRVIIGKFDAFKFSSDVVVRFQVDVQFCLNVCPPTNCNHQHNSNQLTGHDQIVDQLEAGQLLNSQQQLTPEMAPAATTSSPASSHLVPNEGTSTHSPALNQLDAYLASSMEANLIPQTTTSGRRQTSSRPSEHYPSTAGVGGDSQTFEAAALAPPGRHHHLASGVARSSDSAHSGHQKAKAELDQSNADQSTGSSSSSANEHQEQSNQQNSHRSRRRRRRSPADPSADALPKHVPLQREIIVREGPSNSNGSQKDQQVAGKSRGRDARQSSSLGGGLATQKANNMMATTTGKLILSLRLICLARDLDVCPGRRR